MPEEMTPDFKELLDMDASEAVKPPPMPSGTYRCLVARNEMVKSRDKQTPGIQFTFTGWEPLANVDVGKWEAYLDNPVIIKDDISRMDTFWLTRKSMYRLKEFCLKAIRYEGEPGEYSGPMAKLVGDATKQTILVELGQSVSRQTGDVFNEITGYAKDE